MLQAERTATRSPALAGQAEYLPALFVEQERAAPIEPLPPQF